MSDIRVASRYAKSLIELANEKSVLEEISADMQLLHDVISENRDFRLLLENPILKSDKKLAVLNRIFTGKVQPMTLMFFNIVAKKGRESVLVFMAEEFRKQYNLLKGIQVAKITSATSLNAVDRQELITRLETQTGKTIQLEETIDPTLIGGFLLRIGDRQIDSTVKNKLRRLKNDFKDNPYINKL
jgi:F-type H+-transporting ATPase subunit delta